VPRVVQLGSYPDILSRNSGVLNSSTDLSLISVCQGGVDVCVALSESDLYGFLNFMGL
jgi:hypothetical protein